MPHALQIVILPKFVWEGSSVLRLRKQMMMRANNFKNPLEEIDKYTHRSVNVLSLRRSNALHFFAIAVWVLDHTSSPLTAITTCGDAFLPGMVLRSHHHE